MVGNLIIKGDQIRVQLPNPPLLLACFLTLDWDSMLSARTLACPQPWTVSVGKFCFHSPAGGPGLRAGE